MRSSIFCIFLTCSWVQATGSAWFNWVPELSVAYCMPTSRYSSVGFVSLRTLRVDRSEVSSSSQPPGGSYNRRSPVLKPLPANKWPTYDGYIIMFELGYANSLLMSLSIPLKIPPLVVPVLPFGSIYVFKKKGTRRQAWVS